MQLRGQRTRSGRVYSGYIAVPAYNDIATKRIARQHIHPRGSHTWCALRACDNSFCLCEAQPCVTFNTWDRPHTKCFASAEVAALSWCLVRAAL